MKPDSKGCILFEFTHIAFWERQNYRYKTQISGCQGLEVGGEVDDKGEQEGFFLGEGAVLRLGCGDSYMIGGICQNSKNCTLKIVNFTLNTQDTSV